MVFGNYPSRILCFTCLSCIILLSRTEKHMIPIKLSITGFLSYRDPVDIDFTQFDLACISGPNGAGKSSLLDAITWALFGEARKRDDSLINLQSNAAEVVFIFAYEGNTYRIQRSVPRGKTTILEFNILQDEPETGEAGTQRKTPGAQVALSGKWKALTERTLRETQNRIEQTLRMDYDTFVNASFFLQGKADLFTQQRPGERKRILGSILGLEVWETYRQRAADRRKSVEEEISSLDGHLAEINAELAEEATRKALLAGLQERLNQSSHERKTQEKIVENIRKVAATLAEQRRLVQTLERQLEAANGRLNELEIRAAQRHQECEAYRQLVLRAGQIEEAYADWQTQRAELERWNSMAERFREHEARRHAPLMEIEVARDRLAQEQQTLRYQQEAVQGQQSTVLELTASKTQRQQALAEAETRLAQRAGLEAQLDTSRQQQAEARSENPRLRHEMDELKERINQLRVVEGAVCPLCGQPLSEPDRHRLVEELTTQGKELGDRFRANQTMLKDADRLVSELEAQIAELAGAERDRLEQAQMIARLDTQMEQLEQTRKVWETEGVARLEEVSRILTEEDYVAPARQLLAQIDEELKAIGYDAAAHEAARQAEAQGQAIEAEYSELGKARAALAPLEREITDIEAQVSSLRSETDHQQEEIGRMAATLEEAEAQAPSLMDAEQELLSLQEQENHLRLEVGAARQRVLVLDDLKVRSQSLQAGREELARQVGLYKQLERAFGKDGVPALLIEQALPQIEARANDLLDRLSGGSMSVRFATQVGYKDKHREDLKETLEIQISDSAGTRDYELFSGGEAFRVNFAVRLALSEVLAQRAGARLQTLVIDEGFGSQDALGRQRLIEAINLVRPDFAKVLVITHIDELKDAFPTRIEVEKSERGSTARIV